MNVNVARRMTEEVTLVHRTGAFTDSWTSSTYQGSWQFRQERSVGADGTVQSVDVLTVQIPEDQGDVEASEGDWLVRGAFSYEGNTSQLVSQLPQGSQKVKTIRDMRGGITGMRGIERYASVLVLEA